MDFQKQYCMLGLLFILLLCGFAVVDANPPVGGESAEEEPERPEEGDLDFSAAITAVQGARDASGNINYATFCEQPQADLPSAQLLGCRIQSSNGFELRVCKYASGCQESVNSSIEIHDSLRETNLTIVKYSKEQIKDLKCPREEEGSENENKCIGYIEQWITTTGAELIPFNKKVYDEEEESMFTTVKNLQSTAAAKAKTVLDLNKIIDFMTPPAGECTNYKQLCDLEGFFNQDGGFVIHNPSVKYKMMLNDYCHEKDNDPTNARVLEVLNKFVKELQPTSG